VGAAASDPLRPDPQITRRIALRVGVDEQDLGIRVSLALFLECHASKTDCRRGLAHTALLRRDSQYACHRPASLLSCIPGFAECCIYWFLRSWPNPCWRPVLCATPRPSIFL